MKRMIICGRLKILPGGRVIIIVDHNEISDKFSAFSDFLGIAPFGVVDDLESAFDVLDSGVSLSVDEIINDKGLFKIPGKIVSLSCPFHSNLHVDTLEPVLNLLPSSVFKPISIVESLLPKLSIKQTPIKFLSKSVKNYKYRKLGDKWIFDGNITYNDKNVRLIIYNGKRKAFVGWGTNKDKNCKEFLLIIGFEKNRVIHDILGKEYDGVYLKEIEFDDLISQLVASEGKNDDDILIKESAVNVPPVLRDLREERFIEHIPFLREYSQLYNVLTPLLNLILTRLGFVRLSPGEPVGEQLLKIQRIQRRLDTIPELLKEEKDDHKNLIKGLLKSIGITRDVDGKALDIIASAIANLTLPLLFVNPELVNPRSKLALTLELSDLFYRFPGFKSVKELMQFSFKAADQILKNPSSHQGFTSKQIAEIAAEALKKGLVKLDNPSAFADEMSKVTKLLSPIRDMALLKGVPFSASEAVEIAADFVQKHPNLSLSEAAHEMRRVVELNMRGGEYPSLALLPSAAKYIRRAGVPLSELSKQHEQLKENAVNSPFGAGLGAIAKAVKEGLVSPDSPAGKLYRKAKAGEPLGIMFPYEFISILVRSGISPDLAVTMLVTPEESKYWLTPQMINSLRATQFKADWERVFNTIYSTFPGRDKQSKLMREALLSKYVSQAGYKNIHHFLALHGDVLKYLPEMRRHAGEFARVQSELAGKDNIAWGGFARTIAALQDIGAGRDKEKGLFSILGSLLQIYPYKDNPFGSINLRYLPEATNTDVSKSGIPGPDDWFKPSFMRFPALY
ncbi:MAG: hypothetical protein QW303_01235 [Nitrososphaerota archaeon]